MFLFFGYNWTCCLVQWELLQRLGAGCGLKDCAFFLLQASKPCAAWLAPALLWAFCPAVQSVRDGDIYNCYKAIVLAAFHSTVQVQAATIWQGICSATGRALDAATCPQRRHCTLAFGGGEHIAFPPMQEKHTERNLKGAFPLWQWSFMAFRMEALDNMFRMHLMRMQPLEPDCLGSSPDCFTLLCVLEASYLDCV